MRLLAFVARIARKIWPWPIFHCSLGGIGRVTGAPCRLSSPGFPQGLKLNIYFVAFTARLKSCPDASCNPECVFSQPVKPCPFKTSTSSEILYGHAGPHRDRKS